jgi:arylsulfatase A-like enzyme
VRTLVAGVLGGIAVGLLELLAVRSGSPSLWWVIVALHAAVGLLVGLVVFGTELVAKRLPLLPRTLVLAAGSLLVLIPAARHLFDGGFAATLPGAKLGYIWVPALGLLAVAVAILVGRRVGPRVTAAGAAIALVLVEVANRRLFPSEYPDVHAALSVTSIVLAGVILRLLLPPFRRAISVGLVAIAAVGFALCVIAGLSASADRQTIATRGTHGRHLVRVVRLVLDRDGDSYSPALGGADCSDGDPAVHPLAVDPPGDGIDQDCDGIDAPPVMAPVVAAGGDGWKSVSALVAAKDHLVLLLSVDALRGDMLAPSEENRRDFPRLSAILAESRSFTNAFATSAGTDISLPSLLTGRMNPFTDVETTIAAVMRRAGRRTHGVIPREALRWAGTAILTHGLDGHDEVVNDAEEEDMGRHPTSARTTDLGIAFLEAHGDKPAFLWLHYFDVHEHLEVESADATLLAIAGPGRLDRRGKYRALLRLIDREVGRLQDDLVRRGLWDKTIVVLASDHGESFKEDPRLPDTHGRYLYNPLVHVPLAVRVPGVAGGEVATPVSISDVLPTLCDLVGQPPPAHAQGTSLANALAGLPLTAGDRPIVMNESDQNAVVVWPWKLLVRPRENLTELYDLSADFGEKHDLSQAQPERVRALSALHRSIPPPALDRTPRGRRLREEHARQMLSAP